MKINKQIMLEILNFILVKVFNIILVDYKEFLDINNKLRQNADLISKYENVIVTLKRVGYE